MLANTRIISHLHESYDASVQKSHGCFHHRVDDERSHRRLLSNEKTLRFGLKYFYEDDNEFTIGLKPGIDFMFNNSKKWKFFYGLDTSFEYSNNFQSERKYYKIALVPFFRIEYVVSQSFSISTEPGLFFEILKIKDVDGSPIDNSNSSFSSGISSLGVLNLNFSF